jgi:protein phosphatase
MNISYAGLSHIGLIRKNNEDSWYADKSSGLFIVADGMGGHRAGEVASGLVVEHLPQILSKHLPAPGAELTEASIEPIKSALNELNSLVYLQGAATGGHYGMGATAVALLVRNNKAIVGHMGDSRLYLLRNSQLLQVTHDHSITQYLIDLGEISAEEALNHESKGRISQYLGMKADPFPDILLLSLEKHDRLLLCSDGLNGMINDEQICDLLVNHDEPHEACDALVEAAKHAGGNDNITTLIVDITH